MKVLSKISEIRKTKKLDLEEMAEKFNLYLDDHLYSLNDKFKELPDGKIHPSQVSTKDFCSRAWCLSQTLKNPTPRNIDPDLRLIFDTGTFVHLQIQEYLADMGILWGTYKCKKCEKFCKTDYLSVKPSKCPKGNFSKFEYDEIRLEDEENLLKGKCDGVLFPVEPLNNGKYVFEFKTMNTNQFQYLTSPLESHKIQANIYLWILEKTRKAKKTDKSYHEKEREFYIKKFDGQIITYYDKNNSQRKTFIIPYDEKQSQETMDKFVLPKVEECKGYLKDKILPERICKDARQGRKCLRVNKCFK